MELVGYWIFNWISNIVRPTVEAEYTVPAWLGSAQHVETDTTQLFVLIIVGKLVSNPPANLSPTHTHLSTLPLPLCIIYR